MVVRTLRYRILELAWRHSRPWPLVLMSVISLASLPALAQNTPPNSPAGQSPSAMPAFADEDALTVLDKLQAALQSFNRKKFLAPFNSAKMPNFSAFQNEINGLFARYDSFTMNYHLLQTAMQDGNGIALADFGLDATSSSDDTLDLRRHTQLRIVVAWNGKEWKIVDLSPRAIFE